MADVSTMEEKVREWTAELFRLCDQIGRKTNADVDFRLSSDRSVACCVVMILHDGRVKNHYDLYLDPELWGVTTFNYRKAKERLKLILNRGRK